MHSLIFKTKYDTLRGHPISVRSGIKAATASILYWGILMVNVPVGFPDMGKSNLVGSSWKYQRTLIKVINQESNNNQRPANILKETKDNTRCYHMTKVSEIFETGSIHS